MFYRADPNALPLKGCEASNPTLGGIELNSSSVVLKADKKLLTVVFPDGRDGRAFTLKTETLEELNEWKAALEFALAQAPTHVMGQSGIFDNEVVESDEASVEQCKDKLPTTSLIIERPVLFALEDIDGSPSFLEKALRFIEEHGVNVEGILRHSADVEEVKRRVHVFEQGKTEFSPDEDAHVIGDCIKHVLREMPSPPVPASSCTALVNSYRTDRESRVNNIRDAIYDAFPEPNRHLLQRVLQMMLTVASHKEVNRMSLSALAACMAPLLLRPLLAGECELNNGFQVDVDGSFQLLQAAAAANHAQSIMIILLEEYEKIFDDESFSSEPYTESEDEDIDDDESTDMDFSEEDRIHDSENNLFAGPEDRSHTYRETPNGSGSAINSEDGSDSCSYTGNDTDTSNDACSNSNGTNVIRSNADNVRGPNLPTNQELKDCSIHYISVKSSDADEDATIDSNQISTSLLGNSSLQPYTSIHVQLCRDDPSFGTALLHKDDDLSSEISQESTAGLLHTMITNTLVNARLSDSTIQKEAQPAMRSKWGRSSARKNLSMESIEINSDDESVVQRLEIAKFDLQNKILEERQGNAALQSCFNGKKETLHKRRLALEDEVARLQEELHKERVLRSHLESSFLNPQSSHLSTSACLDKKIMTNIEEIDLSVKEIDTLKQNIADLTEQLSHATFCQSCGQLIYSRDGKQENADDVPNKPKIDKSLKHEVGFSSSLKLAKLSNRLNFLKERRVQLANELQYMNLGTS